MTAAEHLPGVDPSGRCRHDIGPVGCVLVAAGSGTRLGLGPKAFVDLAGTTLLGHALAGIAAATHDDGCPLVLAVAVVAPPGHEVVAADVLAGSWPGARPGSVVVTGGADRSASVRAGLAVLPPQAEIVLVHDAARCLTPPDLHTQVARAVATGHDAVVPGLPVVDTVKHVTVAAGPPWPVVTTPPRDLLRAVQTPQGFRRAVLERAHADAGAVASVTDDAGLVEACGGQVWVVPGHREALKITNVDDLQTALAVLAARGQEPGATVGAAAGTAAGAARTTA